MKNFLKFTLASIVGFFVSFVLIFGLMFLILFSITVASISTPDVEVKTGSVLHLKLNRAIEEKVSDYPLDHLDVLSGTVKRPFSLKSIIDNIERAAEDDNIEGIYLDLSILRGSFAMIEDIREALVKFKESGKFVYSYADAYMQTPYYLASVSDSVFMHPEQGFFDFRGFNYEMTFLRETLDKLDIEPKIFTAGDYKSAGEFLERTEMSEENREQTRELLESFYSHFLNGISTARDIEVDSLRHWADNFTVRYPEQALENGFVDGLWYKDELLEFMKKRTGVDPDKELEIISYDRYNSSKGRSPRQERGRKSDDRIALIYGLGQINVGEGGNDMIGSDQMAKTIREARKDENVKAIVLRINSPGGSALASDIIWREVKLAREEKPVVVSMGGLAASGGYYIAAAADEIYARPTSITGSIGVIAMLMNWEKFWKNHAGVSFDRVKTGPYADFGNPNRPMLDEEEEIIKELIQRFYDDFIMRVADGRAMEPERVDSLGGGRVYTGAQAYELGLIDGLGGMYDAIERASELAGIDKYRLQILPRPKTPFERFFEEFSVASKENIMKEQLGNHYEVYKHLKYIKENDEPMAILPYQFEIK